MGYFSIDVKKTKNAVDKEKYYMQELAQIELRISSVKSSVNVGSATSAIRNRISNTASNVNAQTASMKSMRLQLESINTKYETTENALIDNLSNVSSPDINISSAVIATILKLYPATSVLLNLVNILNQTTIQDWLQNLIDSSDNPILNALGLTVEEKNKFGTISTDIEKYKDKIKEFNDNHNKLKDVKLKGYMDENGDWHSAKDDDDADKIADKTGSLEEEATIYKKEIGVSRSAYSDEVEGEYGIASGKASYDVSKSEASASASVGLYSYGEDGQKIFAPGAEIAIGVGYTALSASAEGALGNEYFDVHGSTEIDIGKADMEASANLGIFDEDGKLNPKAKISASAEALLAEASGTVGTKIAGTDVGVKGSVNVGVGAHADIGMADGKVSVDIGASLGVGVSVKLEVDFSGTIDAVSNFVQAAWPF